MSDFLQNLVARSLDQAPTVRPRLVSRFEAGDGQRAGSEIGGANGLEPQHSDMEMATPETTVETPRPTFARFPTTVPPSHARPTQLTADTSPPSGSLLPSLSAANPVPRPSAPPIFPLMPVGTLEVEPRPAPHPTVTRAPVAAQTRDEKEEVFTEHASSAHDMITPAPLAPRAPAAPVHLEEDTHIVERVVETGEARPLAPPSEGTPNRHPSLEPAPRSVITPSVVPARKPEMPDRARLIPEPSLPTINVTIGRIEIRAGAPPAPSRSTGARTATPVMSLDDYLRQRASGGER